MIDYILNSFISPIFYKVLYMSVVGILVGSLILLIRKILDKKISPKWKCVIWLILIISLIVPIKIEIPNENTSVLNISGMAEPIKEISYKEQYNTVHEQFEEESQKIHFTGSRNTTRTKKRSEQKSC